PPPYANAVVRGLESAGRLALRQVSVTRPLCVRLLPVLLSGTGDVGRPQRGWFALGAGVAQTVGPLPAVDCLVAGGAGRRTSNAGVAAQGRGAGLARRCHALQGASGHGR